MHLNDPQTTTPPHPALGLWKIVLHETSPWRPKGLGTPAAEQSGGVHTACEGPLVSTPQFSCFREALGFPGDEKCPVAICESIWEANRNPGPKEWSLGARLRGDPFQPWHSVLRKLRRG